MCRSNPEADRFNSHETMAAWNQDFNHGDPDPWPSSTSNKPDMHQQIRMATMTGTIAQLSGLATSSSRIFESLVGESTELSKRIVVLNEKLEMLERNFQKVKLKPRSLQPYENIQQSVGQISLAEGWSKNKPDNIFPFSRAEKQRDGPTKKVGSQLSSVAQRISMMEQSKDTADLFLPSSRSNGSTAEDASMLGSSVTGKKKGNWQKKGRMNNKKLPFGHAKKYRRNSKATRRSSFSKSKIRKASFYRNDSSFLNDEKHAKGSVTAISQEYKDNKRERAELSLETKKNFIRLGSEYRSDSNDTNDEGILQEKLPPHRQHYTCTTESTCSDDESRKKGGNEDSGSLAASQVLLKKISQQRNSVVNSVTPRYEAISTPPRVEKQPHTTLKNTAPPDSFGRKVLTKTKLCEGKLIGSNSKILKSLKKFLNQ